MLVLHAYKRALIILYMCEIKTTKTFVTNEPHLDHSKPH